MNANDQQNEQKFSVSMDSPELKEILSQLDLALAQTRQTSASLNDPTNTTTHSIASESMDNLIYLADWLKMSSAPLRPSVIGGIKGLLWRILNIPARIFLPAQIGFNNNLREFIDRLVTELNTTNARTAELESTVAALEQKNTILSEINTQREEQITKLFEANKFFQEQLSNLGDVQDQLLTFRFWMKSQDERHTGTEKWIQLLGTEVRSMALETRAVKHDEQKQSHQPRIVKPEEFAKKIHNMGGALKINLGSGNKLVEGYMNIDFRELPGIDVVSEVDNLPFLPETLDEIASAHLVEHFRQYELKTRLLPYWYSLLKPGGMLRITCPNWQAMINQLNAGEMSIDQFKLLTFGGQDYEGNDHFAMYTPESLTAILETVGFVTVETLVEDRDNGGCPEMEILAVRPALRK